MTKRYQFFPQMEYYDKMDADRKVPFALRAGPSRYISKIVNTDEYGFRYTLFKDKYITFSDISQFEEVNLIVGGSAVFGIGASCDNKTIASLLSESTGEVWLNVGVGGATSLTEYIHLIRFMHKAKKIKRIVFFSGINDIYVNQMNESEREFDSTFYKIWEDEKISCKKKIIAYFFSFLYFKKYELLKKKKLKQIFLYPFIKDEFEDKKELTKLSDNEKLDITLEIFKRNFQLYSSLKKEFKCDFLYILQPFAPWTNKKFSKQESENFAELEEIQQNSVWATHKSKLTHELYKNISENLRNFSDEFKVNFKDSQYFFNTDDTIFVDSVHLNDIGNMLVRDLILKEIY